MSVLDVLDATRICSRWSDPDPSVWARPVATSTHRRPVVHRPHSWRSFALNPKAMLLTGLVGVDLARDAVLRALR
jgi:hypothetical protein